MSRFLPLGQVKFRVTMTLSIAMTFPAAAVQLQQHQALPPVLPSEMVAHPPQMPLLTLPLPPYVETQHV